MLFEKIIKMLPVPVNMGLVNAGFGFISNIYYTKVMNKPAKRGPLFVTWLATYECNVACKFCSTHSLKKQFPEEISLARAREIAYEMVKAKTYAVGFTGGEVLLWPHLFDVVKILKKHKIVVYIVTNGLLLKEKVDEIIESGIDYIVVSIDSDNPAEHDELRNSPGLYKGLIEGIELLKRKRKGKRPLIKSNTVIYRDNLQKLDKLLDITRSLVDVTSFQPISGGYASGVHGKSDDSLQSLSFNGNKQKHVEGLFDKFIHKNNDFDCDYFKFIPRYWFNKESLMDEILCWSPFLRLQIIPNGDVFHCLVNANYTNIGNIKKSSLQEIWNSSEMIRQREEIRLHKNHCICWTQDTSFNSFLNSVPLTKRLPVLNKKKICG